MKNGTAYRCQSCGGVRLAGLAAVIGGWRKNCNHSWNYGKCDIVLDSELSQKEMEAAQRLRQSIADAGIKRDKMKKTYLEKEGMYVVCFKQTAHGKMYWNVCSEGDIIRDSETIMVSESFYVDEGCCVEEAFQNAFSVSIDDYADAGHPLRGYEEEEK